MKPTTVTGYAIIGSLGGHARARSLTPERRKQIAAMGGKAGKGTKKTFAHRSTLGKSRR